MGEAHLLYAGRQALSSWRIEHARCQVGLIENRAAEYLAGAINVRQMSKGCRLWATQPA